MLITDFWNRLLPDPSRKALRDDNARLERSNSFSHREDRNLEQREKDLRGEHAALERRAAELQRQLDECRGRVQRAESLLEEAAERDRRFFGCRAHDGEELGLGDRGYFASRPDDHVFFIGRDSFLDPASGRIIGLSDLDPVFGKRDNARVWRRERRLAAIAAARAIAERSRAEEQTQIQSLIPDLAPQL